MVADGEPVWPSRISGRPVCIDKLRTGAAVCFAIGGVLMELGRMHLDSCSPRTRQRHQPREGYIGLGRIGQLN